MYLITQTRSGTSAKQLERMLGVTYKTAWRIYKQIRTLMAENSITPLDGDVEIDETYIGGKGMNRRFKPNFNEIPKLVVMGMLQRGGKTYLKHIKGSGKWYLIEQIKAHVDPVARLITDELAAYKNLPKHGYMLHDVVNHSETYVIGDIHTNNIENVWSIIKRGIYGVYRNVSKKYLQAYIDEYSFRFNYRNQNRNMFYTLLNQVVNVQMASS
jgi:transposase-like protein